MTSKIVPREQRGYEQLHDGVGITLRSRQPFKFRCCDCGLTHRIVLVIGKGGWIGMAVKRLRGRKT